MGCANTRTSVQLRGGILEPLSAILPSLASGRDFHSCYVLGEKLGMGAFSVVYSGSNADERSREVAIKVLDVRTVASRGFGFEDARLELEPFLQRKAREEVRIMKVASCVPHVCQFYNFFISGGLAYMVLEKCDRTLFEVLQQTAELNEFSLRPLIREMLMGLHGVHMQGIIHRDVKPTNFMCCGPNNTVKLCDFGLACFVRSPQESNGCKGECGTPAFMAPEMLTGKPYGCGIDVWALGVLTYTLLFGSLPYMPPDHSREAMKCAIRTGKPEPSFRSIDSRRHGETSQRALRLTRQLLHRSPQRRPSSRQAFGDDFFRVAEVSRASLRQELQGARICGVFELRQDISLHSAIDIRLHELQQVKHAVDLPHLVGKEPSYWSNISTDIGLRESSSFCSVTDSRTNEDPFRSARTIEEPVRSARTNEKRVRWARTSEDLVRCARTQEEPVMSPRTHEEPVRRARTQEEAGRRARTHEEPVRCARTKEDTVMCARISEEPIMRPRTNEEPARRARSNEEPVRSARTNEESVRTARAREEPVRRARTKEEAGRRVRIHEERVRCARTNEDTVTCARINEELGTCAPTNEEPLGSARTNEERARTARASEEPMRRAHTKEEAGRRVRTHEEPVRCARTDEDTVTCARTNEDTVKCARSDEELAKHTRIN